MREDLEHSVSFSPSRNWIKEDSSRNYGVTTTRIRFVVKGPQGAIQWMIGTLWGSEPVREHLQPFGHRLSSYEDPRKPNGWDLGYHSPVPQYDGRDSMECDILEGDCYYDGSGLNADEVVEGFLAGGTEWLWPKLEEYYEHVFNNGPWPDFTPVHLPHPDDVEEPSSAPKP